MHLVVQRLGILRYDYSGKGQILLHNKFILFYFISSDYKI